MPIRAEVLTPDELRRLLASLQRRFDDHPDVKSVGIGSAIKDGSPDPDRPLVARLWVKRKRARVSRQRQLPRSVAVRLRRGDRFETIELPVDITETSEIRRTAEINPGDLTTSAIARWNGDSLAQPAYGFFTCAHGFGGRTTCRDGAETRCRVSVDDEHGDLMPAWVRWRSTRAQGVDAAVCGCDRDELRDWLGTNLPTAQHEIAPTEDLPFLAALKTPGRTLSTASGSPIRLLSYTPGPIDLDGDEKLPPLRHVVEADARADFTFEEGTSGSIWEADGRLVAMQSAGLRPRFERGYAVGLRASLAKAFVGLNASSLVLLDHPI